MWSGSFSQSRNSATVFKLTITILRNSAPIHIVERFAELLLVAVKAWIVLAKLAEHHHSQRVNRASRTFVR